MSIILKKCEICLVKDIPPFNRNGIAITRQSKYNERKTCGEECFRISKQTNYLRNRASKRPPGPVVVPITSDPIQAWLRGSL